MIKKTLFLLMGIFSLFSCNDSDDRDDDMVLGEPTNLKGELVVNQILLSWDAPRYTNELEYDIYIQEGEEEFKLIATTVETSYTDKPIFVGSNIFKVRAKELNNTLYSNYSNEVLVMVAANIGDMQALYSILKKNTHSGLRWEFDFDNSDNPINIRNYSETVRFSNIDGEKRVTWLSLSSNTPNQYISDLSDISELTALTSLSCGNNKLSSLDVSKNIALVELSCINNNLTSLDVSSNIVLRNLRIADNNLTSIDLSANKALRILTCSDNKLSLLDVSNNEALAGLSCDRNQLTSLDVSNNAALTILFCNRNQLTSLDVSNNTSLATLFCSNNQLTSLSISINTPLKLLSCENNQLTSLDVSNNTLLTTLFCSENKLSSLNVSNSTALTALNCNLNRLASLDVSSNTALVELDCTDNLFQDNMVAILKSFIDKSQSTEKGKTGYLSPSKSSLIYKIIGE